MSKTTNRDVRNAFLRGEPTLKNRVCEYRLDENGYAYLYSLGSVLAIKVADHVFMSVSVNTAHANALEHAMSKLPELKLHRRTLYLREGMSFSQLMGPDGRSENSGRLGSNMAEGLYVPISGYAVPPAEIGTASIPSVAERLRRMTAHLAGEYTVTDHADLEPVEWRAVVPQVEASEEVVYPAPDGDDPGF